MLSVQLSEADADHLLKIGKLLIGWISCRIRTRKEVKRYHKCLGYGQFARNCGPYRSKIFWRCDSPDHTHKIAQMFSHRIRKFLFHSKGTKELNNPAVNALPYL